MEKIRTYALAFAALLMALTTYAHAVHGGPEINSVVQASDLPSEVRAASAVVWHMITVTLVAAALIAAYLIWCPNRALAVTLAVFHAAFASLFIVIGLSEFSDILTLPQWTAFAVCCALTLPALRT